MGTWDVLLGGTLILALVTIAWLLLTGRRHTGKPGLRPAIAFLRQQGTRLIELPGRLRRLAADPRTPRRARWMLTVLAVYLVNPIDLIPDFIPVLGQLDDVAIAALLLWLAWRAIPADVWGEHFPPGEAVVEPSSDIPPTTTNAAGPAGHKSEIQL